MKYLSELDQSLSNTNITESNKVSSADLVEAFLQENEELLNHHAVYPQLCTEVSRQIKDLGSRRLQNVPGDENPAIDNHC